MSNSVFKRGSRYESVTPRQVEVLRYVDEYQRQNGYAVSVREVGERFQIGSPNGVMAHIRALTKKGLIERKPNLSRTMRLTAMGHEVLTMEGGVA